MPLHQRFGLTTTVRASFALYNTLAEIDHEQRSASQADVSRRTGNQVVMQNVGNDMTQRKGTTMNNQSQRLSLPILLGLLILAAGRAVQAEETGLPTIMRRAGWTRSRPGGRWSCWQVRRGAAVPGGRVPDPQAPQGRRVRTSGRGQESGACPRPGDQPTPDRDRLAAGRAGWIVTRTIGVPAIKKLFEPHRLAACPRRDWAAQDEPSP